MNGNAIFVQTADKSVTNTATETTLLTTGDGFTLFPADFLYDGRCLSLVMRGYYSLAVIVPTMTCRIKLGGTTLVTATASGLVGLVTNRSFNITATMTCRTAGASGVLSIAGDMRFESTLGTMGTGGFVQTTPATINTTVANQYDVTLQWGTASANNTATINVVLLQCWN